MGFALRRQTTSCSTAFAGDKGALGAALGLKVCVASLWLTTGSKTGLEVDIGMRGGAARCDTQE